MKATTETARGSGRWKKLGWFVLIWVVGVATIATVGYGLRAVVGHIYGV